MMTKKSALSSGELNEVKQVSEYLKAISDPHRLQIIYLLREGECCVCEIYEALQLSQNLVSHHLKVLREAGVVEVRRDGTWMRYRISERKISQYQKTLDKKIRPVKSAQG